MVNIHTIKPLDVELVVAVAREARAVVTVEEHQIAGGLGSTIAETVAQHVPVPIEFVGVKDEFGQSGTPSQLIEHYGMGQDAITKAIITVLERKAQKH